MRHLRTGCLRRHCRLAQHGDHPAVTTDSQDPSELVDAVRRVASGVAQQLTSEAEDAGFTGLDMKDSWGLAYQVGMDYMLTENIMINGQLRYIDIDTTGTTYAGTTKVDVDVDVDPFVYMVGLGYKF